MAGSTTGGPPADVAAAPVVSVLVPCWNAEATIASAIDSVLEERSMPLECIVVDDASTDRTASIVADAAARDPRIVLVRLPENGGVSNARNRGLERVRGTWLTMLDADDRFEPGGLGVLLHATAQSGASQPRAVIGQQVVFDGRRRWLPGLYDVPDLRRPGRKSLVANPGLLNSVSPHAKLFHRSCFEGLRFSGRVLGDQPWIIRALIRAGNDIEVLGETVYAWRRPAVGATTGSITSTTRASARRSVEAVEVATGAVATVEAEAAALGRAGRDAIVQGYIDRLLRADLGPMLTRAIARRDPATAELLDAIRVFVERVNPNDLAATAALSRELLEPTLRMWRRLGPGDRAALDRLVEAALAADPACLRRRPPLARLGLAIGLDGAAAPRRAVGAAVLTVHQWLVRARRRVLRLRERW